MLLWRREFVPVPWRTFVGFWDIKTWYSWLGLVYQLLFSADLESFLTLSVDSSILLVSTQPSTSLLEGVMITWTICSVCISHCLCSVRWMDNIFFTTWTLCYIIYNKNITWYLMSHYRFLKSESLDKPYWRLYRPTTGAFLLLTALHLCDQVMTWGCWRGHRHFSQSQWRIK